MESTLRILFFICFFYFASIGYSATILPVSKNTDTKITSNRAEYDSVKQLAVFSGNVHVLHSDFQLWSDRLIIQLEKVSRTAKTTIADNMQLGKISKIIAEKNVVIKKETREARADKATYTVDKDEFKLEGSPWIKDKNNVIRGETIYHYLKKNRSVVTRGDINFSSPNNTEKK